MGEIKVSRIEAKELPRLVLDQEGVEEGLGAASAHAKQAAAKNGGKGFNI